MTKSEADNLRVVLVAARNPLNIGAAARAMSNFGFTCLRVVNCYGVAFREARSAVGASGVLVQAEEFSSVAEAVADCGLVVGTTAAEARKPVQPLYRLDAAGSLLHTHLGVERVAVLFGSEKRGLSNDDLNFCRWIVRIPTCESRSDGSGNPSMNLGQAVAVCLYELIRDEAARLAFNVRPQATGAALERMTRALLGTLEANGYIKPGAESITEEKVQRLIRRMSLSEEDAMLWTGMLAKGRPQR